MNSVYPKPTEVSKSDPCPICDKPDWCCWLPDGAIVCGRVDIPPDGWIKAGKHAKDGRNIFQPVRNRANPRPNRSLPSWKRTGKRDGSDYEMEIVFWYSETQKVVRKQWSNRRPAYNGKTKYVRPFHKVNDQWLVGTGSNPWELYRIDDLQSSDVLFFVGGETCVETMRKWGFSATCHQGGEGGYVDEIIESLQTQRFLMLVIIPDNDETGFTSSQKLLEAALKSGLTASILEPSQILPDAPEKWDVADWDVDIQGAQSKISELVAELTPHKNEAEESSIEGLRGMAAAYGLEQDPFARAILGKEISSTYGVRGSQLEDLARIAIKPDDLGHTSLADGMADVFDEIVRRANGEAPKGIPSGFLDLDGMTQGYQPEDLILLGARPSQGKTSAAIANAMESARQGYPTYFFSLEMSKMQLYYRMLSVLAGIQTGRLRSGHVRDDEWDLLDRATEALGKLPIYINDTPQMTVPEIRDSLVRAEHQPGIVFIDYLQLIEGPGQHEASKYSNISRQLKQMARSLHVPVIALSQLNRGVESRQDKRPLMSDLRESGGLEQDADLIMMLYRDEYYNPESTDRGIAELNIVKHRNGPTGTVKLLFETEYTRFRNLAR